MKTQVKKAKKFGYSVSGEAFAIAAILFKEGKLEQASEAIHLALVADDSIELATTLQQVNSKAVERSINNSTDEINEDDSPYEEILSALDRMSDYVEESDYYEDDLSEFDSDEDLIDSSNFEFIDEDLDEFDEPEEDDEDIEDNAMMIGVNRANRRSENKKNVLASLEQAINNKATLGLKPTKIAV